ncbi:MAG: nuclear transport factor 2 family protein [Pirellulaceae bacterium]
MPQSTEQEQQELLALTQRLLDCIAAGDWDTYQALCDPTLSAFEPESCGELVIGLDFHRYYFDLKRASASQQSRVQTTIASPHVRLLGDVAVVSCIRLVQFLDDAGAPQTARFEETRVWRRQDGVWRHLHFHRSA